MNPLTPERLAEIEKRCNAATAGPWFPWLVEKVGWTIQVGVGWLFRASAKGTEQDARFIAHARTDIPDLLSEIKRLREELQLTQIGTHRLEGTIVQYYSETTQLKAQLSDAQAALKVSNEAIQTLLISPEPESSWNKARAALQPRRE